jgi:lysozyme
MTEYIQGIDVSKWQGDVNFAEVAAAGFRFAIVKCGEGTNSFDERFVENWNKLVALDGDIYRGAYHFARPDTQGGDEADARREATSFCNKLIEVGHYGSNCLPPAIDFEKYSDNGPDETQRYLETYVKVIEDMLGRSPMVYTGANVWRYEAGNRDYLSHLPLWQVAYTTASAPQKITGWDKWTIWQWSAGGTFNYYGEVPGVKGDCDVNRYWGDENSLRALATPSKFSKASPWNPDSEAHADENNSSNGGTEDNSNEIKSELSNATSELEYIVEELNSNIIPRLNDVRRKLIKINGKL